MEAITHLLVRIVVGLVSAGLLSFGGYIFSNLFIPPTAPDEHLFVNIRLIFVGAGAAVGATAGWAIRDETRPPVPLIIFVALVGGFLGAWVGLIFAEGTTNVVALWVRHLHVTQTTVLSAAIGANLLLLIVGGFTAWLRRAS